VEAAGQRVPSLSRRAGLCLHPESPVRFRSGACYPGMRSSRILVSARSSPNQPTYESLQGSESWPSTTPRRRHAVHLKNGGRVHRMSPVITLPLQAKATICDPSPLIEPASASTTQQDATCLAHSLVLAARYPKGREDVQQAAERFNGPACSTPDARACERVLRIWMHKHMPGRG